jgi:AcrR family transcriptional regulator
MTHAEHSEQAVSAAADDVLAEARRAGRRATVTALAEKVGMTRPTLYRNHPGLVADFLERATDLHRAAPPRRTANQQLQNKLSRLRQENKDLRRHVAIYEDHIRRLATDNARLREELGQRSGVSDLTAHRQRRRPAPIQLAQSRSTDPGGT